LNNVFDGIFKVSAVGSNLDKGKFISLDKTDVPSRTSVLKAKIKTNDLTDSFFIRMTSIDEIVEEHNLPSVDMIKIDVEGYEKNVLYGALNTIERFRPLIYLEFKESKLEILKFAKSKKYLSYLPTIKGNLIRINELEITENDYENIFLIPQENNLRL
jgi:FkbM family methyltransferase